MEIQKFAVQKIQNIKNLKIQIRSAQNVGKVWVSRKKSSWPHFGPSEVIFPWTGKIKKMLSFSPIFLGGLMGPIHPVWAPLLSTRGGEMGNSYQLGERAEF